MAYLAPIHPPSSIRHALKLRFLSPDEDTLVVAKSDRLEFFVQTPDGLALKHSRAIYGRITMLNKLRPASSATDHLFVGTDKFMYFTLSWNAKKKQLHTEQTYVDQADKSARDTQTGDRCLIDPKRNVMTLELYEGIITVIPIAEKPLRSSGQEAGTLCDPIQKRMPELFVKSSTFIQSRVPAKGERPKLALLFENKKGHFRLKVKELDVRSGDEVELNDAAEIADDLDSGASHLIPVEAPACGVLILSETSITYYEPSKNERLTQQLKEPTVFVTWEQIDRQRFILADDYGKLYLLMLDMAEDGHVGGWKIDTIGETSRASVLIYLEYGNVFVGSHSGDSQIVNIKGANSMDVIQTFPNIAPILDFTIMDMGNRTGEGQVNEYSSGQARLVSGSGAYNDGSLRSLRSGVGLEDLGILGQMENIIDMFSLKSNSSNQYVDTLVASFIGETRVFRFSPDGDVEEVEEFGGLTLGEGTILAANVSNGRLLQVTSTSATLSDVESGMVISEWSPPNNQKITDASANADVAAVSIGGTSLVILDTSKDLSVRTERNFGADNQIACMHISPSNSSICVVGFWKSSAVSVLSLNDLSTIQTEQTSEDEISVPRGIVLVDMIEGADPVLFVSLADGNVLTYSMDPKTCALSGKKSMVLGKQQAKFNVLPRGDGLCNVFAICEHPSLIYGSEGRIVYSAITAEQASCVCPFDSRAFPGAIAIASPGDLKLAVVDEERSTHVRGLHVGSTVRRLAYSPELKAFGLGTIKRTLEDGVEVVQSHFKLADEVMFNVLATYRLNEEELVETVIRAPLNDSTGMLAEHFIVGTAYLDEEQDDAVRGRILVFEVTEDRSLKLVTELSVKGACRCLAIVEGRIVAALIKTVVVYALEYETASRPFLTKQASYRTATAPIDLAVEANTIAIADLMKSVSVVEYRRGKNGEADTLTEVARHFQTTWGTAVALVDDNTFLESDAEGNLMVLTRDVKGVTFEDRRRLQVTSEMLLGEMVNRIRRITVESTPDATVIPRAFLATVEGSIYLFALIADTKKDLLMRLQTQLAAVVRSPGDVPFNKHRAFKNQVREQEEPFRFVDGELVERFLDCGVETQEAVVKAMGIEGLDVEEVRVIVEGLRRLR